MEVGPYANGRQQSLDSAPHAKACGSLHWEHHALCRCQFPSSGPTTSSLQGMGVLRLSPCPAPALSGYRDWEVPAPGRQASSPAFSYMGPDASSLSITAGDRNSVGSEGSIGSIRSAGSGQSTEGNNGQSTSILIENATVGGQMHSACCSVSREQSKSHERFKVQEGLGPLEPQGYSQLPPGFLSLDCLSLAPLGSLSCPLQSHGFILTQVTGPSPFSF